MAVNKNAELRYRVLDSCFRNSGKRYFIEDLIQACDEALLEVNPGHRGLSRRQLFSDIRYMESEAGYAIPLEKKKDGKKTYYQYSDRKFSITNQPFKEDELKQLQSAMLLLSKFKGIPQLRELEDIIIRLQSGSGPVQVNPVVSFDENPYLVGLSHFGPLFNAIQYKKVLKIRYKAFSYEEAQEFVMHPYHLKQFNNRWFLFGYNDVKDISNMTLALDRMEDIRETRLPYRECDLDWEEYFEEIIGVTRLADKTPIDILIWFDDETYPYIRTKPLHGSQTVVANTRETGTLIKLQLIPNFEFYQRILAFGKNVEILSPPEVVEHIGGILKAAAEIYN